MPLPTECPDCEADLYGKPVCTGCGWRYDPTSDPLYRAARPAVCRRCDQPVYRAFFTEGGWIGLCFEHTNPKHRTWSDVLVEQFIAEHPELKLHTREEHEVYMEMARALGQQRERKRHQQQQETKEAQRAARQQEVEAENELTHKIEIPY